MKPLAKLAVFFAVLAVLFAGAAAVGSAVGPLDVGSSEGHGDEHIAGEDTGNLPRGLAVAAGGYRLILDAPEAERTTASTLQFRIVTIDGGDPLTHFDIVHDRSMHLIVLSRNVVDYLHLHPEMDARGTWTVPLPALAPGSYRVFADFQPTGGGALTLATDLSVAGTVVPADVPGPSAVASVGGYDVRLHGMPMVGESEVTFEIERHGAVVAPDPYLGARGHLVAIREGDLAFLHVHPLDGAGPEVTFGVDLPSPGVYRLFFEFSADGTVTTAPFTVEVAP